MCRISTLCASRESCKQNVTTLRQCNYLCSCDTDCLGNGQLGWIFMLYFTGSYNSNCSWCVHHCQHFFKFLCHLNTLLQYCSFLYDTCQMHSLVKAHNSGTFRVIILILFNILLLHLLCAVPVCLSVICCL